MPPPDGDLTLAGRLSTTMSAPLKYSPPGEICCLGCRVCVITASSLNTMLEEAHLEKEAQPQIERVSLHQNNDLYVNLFWILFIIFF